MPCTSSWRARSREPGDRRYVKVTVGPREQRFYIPVSASAGQGEAEAQSEQVEHRLRQLAPAGARVEVGVTAHMMDDELDAGD